MNLDNSGNLRQFFGERMQENVSLARYTASRIGGAADVLVTVDDVETLAQAVQTLWALNAPFVLLGGGSNVLVSDKGVRGVVLLNKAKNFEFQLDADPPAVWAESGVNFGKLARQAARKGLGGLEWAAGIPGTIGGAVFGNAGAHGGNLAGNLIQAEVLHKNYSRETWPVEQFAYEYRSSKLKKESVDAIVLAATLRLNRSPQKDIENKMEAYLAQRRKTQPPGASMGSMFKNPPGDYAGRLIDAVGLKGTRVGGAQISALHANFFVNQGDASAEDVWMLLTLARDRVKVETGIELELEIELIGEW